MVRGKVVKIRLKTPTAEDGRPYSFEEGEPISEVDERAVAQMAARLDEYDRDEWRDVVRLFRPDWTDEQFDEAWERFCAMKRGKEVQ